jgi:protease secretion system membrane fusion protein
MAIPDRLTHTQVPPAQETGPYPAKVIDAETPLPMDTAHSMRVGLLVLVLGLGGAVLWAALAPLDEGVPASGMVAIDTKRKAVQHQQGGIVSEVLVKEGSMVKAGDLLIRLNDSAVRANYAAINQQYMTLRAMEGRLMAEQADAPKITFHEDLLKAKDDREVRLQLANQEHLFISRRSAIQAELAAIQELIHGYEAQLQSYAGLLENRKIQLSWAQEELKGIRDLVSEGYAPRNRQMELERTAAELSGSTADLQGNILRTNRSISEQKLRIIQRRQEYRKEVETQLSEVRREVQADAEKVKASSEELARSAIRAPAEGQVVGLAVQTVGAVIGPGQKLMDIVPENETLLLEARVAPHMIDRVHPGLEVDARFSSFAHSPQLVVTGRVISVSADLIIEQQSANTPPYYLARVAVTPDGMKQLGNRHMQPGMPVEVIFKTGDRTVLTYLLHPLTKRIAASMKEE